MKRNFSCLAIIMTILLFGASGQIEAMGVVSKIGVEAAQKAATKVGMKVDGAFLTALTKIADDTVTKLQTKFASALAKTETKAAASAAMQAEMKSAMKSIGASAAKLDAAGIKLANVSEDLLGAMSKGDISAFNKGIDDLVDQGTLKNTAASIVKQDFKSSQGILTRMADTGASMKGGLTKSLKNTFAKAGTKDFEKLAAASENLAKADATIASTTATVAQKEAATAARNTALKDISKVEYKQTTYISRVGKGLKALGGKLEGPLMMAGGTMAAAVLFMIPSIFQSAFLAQQAENAMLQTYLPPVKFGNIVMQLPDSAVNMGNPIMSQFIYYGIPVNNPGEGLSAQAQAAYPGVSGPTSKNKVSAGVDNSYAQAFTVGATKKIKIPRYNLDAKALATLPIFVSYSDQSWMEWGANGIPDAAFSQTMINLNTGYIFYADGTSQGAAPAPLVGLGTNGKTVQSYMAKKYGTADSSDTQHTYKDYVDSYSSAKGNSVSPVILAQFNCSCLSKNNGILSEDTLKICSAGSETCLLTSALNQLSAGLVLNASGKVMTPDQNLDTELAKGALGQIIPIQGLGANFDSILQLFPGAVQNAMTNSGVLTVSLGTNLSSATTATIQGAEPDNYAAKGVYVYQCKNTPLAKILRSQSGGSVTSNNQIVDYIVFLDSNLNQVPLMVPVQDPNNYNFIKMGLNPAIAYFSTIIGNMDANGQFSFLPQLNIQSPAALVAKGLPATFPPLYGLAASGGSLAVNYNQNLTSTIGTIATALLGHAKLGQQFKAMQSAMMNLLAAGPYGKYNLSPVPSSMQPAIGGVNLMLYTGFNGYPVSQDKANAACTDVLVPLSTQGKTVTLPSNNVGQYYGLVTDLSYIVKSDGTIVVGAVLPATATNPNATISIGAAGFANSPLSVSGAIDTSKAANFYWMSKLTAMGQNNDPNFVMPPALTDFVTKARIAWINWIQSIAKSGLNPAEFRGVTVAGTSNVLTIASQQALQNGLYVYTCSPCPSKATQDYFVLTNSASPQATDATLGKMSATKATAATNMLSLVSGLLYNATGAQVLTSSGAAYSVTATSLLTTINGANPQALSNDFKIQLNKSVGLATSAAMAMQYPFQFGSLQLGLYQADIDANVYLYFNAAGAGASANFQPSDYFVAIDSYTSPSKIGAKLSSSTPYMVSLVSGQVSGPAGVVSTMSASMISQIIGKLSPQWRSGVAGEIAALTLNFIAANQAATEQTTTMNNAPLGNTGSVTWPQASVVQVINNIAGLDVLADPYNMLKQDPTSSMYVLVTPANADETQFMYTFFNVPSSALDPNGKPIRIGASYDAQGNLLRTIQGIELASMMANCGVSIDSAGKQYLGATNSLPIMQLDPADVALKPGMSGKSMIVSTDLNFPSYGIASPVSYQNSQFYFYYNTITLGYYAMQVNGSDIRYIDMAGGSVYNLNGSPRMASNPVAVNSNGDVTDMLLSYADPDGFIRCVMKNADNNNTYADFYNSSDDFQVGNDPVTDDLCGYNLLYALDATSASVNVSQMPFPDPSTLTAMPDISSFTDYNVYFDGGTTPVSYTVNPNYTWQNLQILPIDMKTRALLSPLPDDMYTNASLVATSKGMYAMVFANQFYSGAQPNGTNSYTMKSGSSSITVSMQMDTKTNAQYVQVVAGGVTYNYQCPFMTLIDSQLADYRHNAWQAEIVADVAGNILLEQYISVDGSGQLQLIPVSNNAVTNMPTDATAKSAISAALGYILQDAGTGRFMAQVAASTYPYFNQDGYVDLENGVLFDTTGMLVGYTLQYADLMNLLSSLSIAILRDANEKATLTYRAPMLAAAVNPVMSTLAPSYVPSAAPVQAQESAPVQTYAPAPTYNPAPATYAPVQTYAPAAPVYVAPAQEAYVAPAAPAYVAPAAPVQQAYTAPATNYAAAPAPSAPAQSYSSNPQVAKLQQQNAKLQADIALRTQQLKSETIAHRKQVLQNAILTDQQQIDFDNKQIAALGGVSSARSTVLGRFSSKSNKKAKSQVKKSKK